METLNRWVSDRHDGFAGRAVEGMKVRRRCPSEDTSKKYGDPKDIWVSNRYDGCAEQIVEGMMVRHRCP